jgi:hypothetical protein
MPPVDPPRFRVQWPPLVQVTMFLPQFVGEKEGDDKQRNDQKNAQYQVLDHGGLRLQEHGFIVEHRTYPHGAHRRCDANWPSPLRLPGTVYLLHVNRYFAFSGKPAE